MKNLIRHFCHFIFQSHLVTEKTKLYAQKIHHSRILEIGSGRNPASRFFDATNEFVASDLFPSSKKILKLDLERMKFNRQFDLIVCINVLDDIFNYQLAVDNLYTALKPQGKIFLVVNGLYPLHDLPHDYWRFTEFSLKKIFHRFSQVNVETIGLKYFPSYYVLTAQK